MDFKMVELSKIKVSDHNSRKTFDETKMKELTASVREKGILNPILLRPSNGSFELVCGERRLRAAKEAGLKEIPAVVRTLTDQQALECMVIENLQREDVHPLEEAEGYEKLLKLHVEKKLMTIDDLAAKVGKSKTYVYGRLALCKLIPENRKYFYDGRFSPSIALLVARVPEHLQKEAGKKVACGQWNAGPLSYADAKKFIHEHFMLQLKEAKFDTKEKGFAGKCSCLECTKRTGNQKDLFPDVSGADICTDPACFAVKKNAFTQRTIDTLKKEGKKFLSKEEIGKAFPYSSEHAEGNYINLEQYCHEDPKNRPFSQLIKGVKDAQVSYAVHPVSGNLIHRR